MIAKLNSIKNRFELAWNSKMKELYEVDDHMISKATHYAAVGQGKRIRPLMTMLICDLLSGDLDGALHASIAIEMVHTYSLVHDDLPSMDNDDTRRGRPTTHKAFSESMAILAGDSLLTDAFKILAENESLEPNQRLQIISELSRGSGSKGMVLGQGIDIEYSSNDSAASQNLLLQMHQAKTGALMAASLVIGAICANRQDLIPSLREAGTKVGLVFQIIDDLLDNSAETGKTPGKDAASKKLTFLKLYSEFEAEEFARVLTREAKHLISGEEILHPFCEFIDQLLERKK